MSFIYIQAIFQEGIKIYRGSRIHFVDAFCVLLDPKGKSVTIHTGLLLFFPYAWIKRNFPLNFAGQFTHYMRKKKARHQIAAKLKPPKSGVHNTNCSLPRDARISRPRITFI